MAKRTVLLNIYELIEAYAEARVRLALNDHDLRFTLDQLEKRKEKLEDEVFKTSMAVNTRINTLHDQATKARNASLASRRSR